MTDTFAKMQGFVLWALAYPIFWVSIAWGIVGLIGLFSLVGIGIGFKMKWEERKIAKRP